MPDAPNTINANMTRELAQYATLEQQVGSIARKRIERKLARATARHPVTLQTGTDTPARTLGREGDTPVPPYIGSCFKIEALTQ